MSDSSSRRPFDPTLDTSHSTLYLYRRLYHYIRPYFLKALVATLITIPIGALDGAIAYSLKPYVDGMAVKASIAKLNYVPLVIVGFTLIQGGLNYLSIYLNGWLGFRIMSDIRRDLFHKLQTIDVYQFDVVSSGSIIQSYFRDPESLQANILNNARQILTRFFSSIGLAGVLIATSWQLSIIAIGILLLVLYPSTRIRKIIKNMVRQSNATMGNILSFYTETVGGIRVVYGYNLPKFREKKFDQLQRYLFTQTMKSIKAQGWLTPSMHMVASVGVGLIIWQGSLMVARGEMTTGAFVSFMAAMLMLYNPIKNLGSSIMNTHVSLFAASRIFNLLDADIMVKDKVEAKVMSGFQESLAFDNASFAYINTFVIKDFTLTIRKGETVAIVGPSGGGKTTLVNLIPRFYDVQRGAIRVDGVDIRDLTKESLRDHIALVLQDAFLFDGSIRDNVLIGKPGADEEQVWDAVRRAYLEDFVKSLPEGLDTHVGERGVMLSGGQRQRIAIARALLKDAPIVILDEATSALDNESEVIVQKAIDSLMVDKTVIIIAHRLSTIRNANRIAVVEDGRLVEEGSHEALLAAEGLYSRLYQTQFRTLKVTTQPDASPLEPVTV